MDTTMTGMIKTSCNARDLEDCATGGLSSSIAPGLRTRTIDLVAICVAATWLIASDCAAQNVMFLPGDAFFATSISSDRVKELPAGEITRFYSLPDSRAPVLGPYVGVLQVSFSITQEQINSIGAVCAEIEQFEPPIIEELPDRKQRLNAPRMFIYPQSCREELEKIPLFLKCNESWMDQAKPLGVEEFGDIKLIEFVPSQVAESWRFAKRVPELPVEQIEEASLRFRAMKGVLRSRWFCVIVPHLEFSRYTVDPDLVEIAAYVVDENSVIKGVVRNGRFSLENGIE